MLVNHFQPQIAAGDNIFMQFYRSAQLKKCCFMAGLSVCRLQMRQHIG